MKEIVIASAARTPIGSFNGSLSSVPAHYLGQAAIVETMRRANVDANEVTEVINVNGGAIALGHPIGASGTACW